MRVPVAQRRTTHASSANAVACNRTQWPFSSRILELASRLGLTVTVDAGLAEGAGPSHALSLIEQSEYPLALCSHGDVIGDTMNALSRRGLVLDDDRVAKASVWALTVLDGVVTAARYLPPSP